MDYQSLLYDPAYELFGVAAELTPPGWTAGADLTVLDKSAGVVVSGGDGAAAAGYEIDAVRPAAIVRAVELSASGIVAGDDLDGAALTMNGRTWRIEAHMPKPSPLGEGDGEILMILVEDT